MAKIAKEIVEKFKERFINYDNLISLTLIGSFSNLNKKLTKFNDLDLVFIFKKITKKDLNKLKDIAKEIKNKFSNKEIGLTHSFKIGPIKIPSGKKKTIMLHYLVYSKEGYLKYETNPTKFSFQNYKPLIGKSLKKIYSIKKIEREDLFNENDGIPAMKRWIKKRKAEYLEPTEKGIKISAKKPEDNLYLEIIFYSVLRLASNMLKLKEKYLDTNKTMCKEFIRFYPIKLNEFPKEVLSLKQKLRNGKKFSKNEIKILRLKTLGFIKQCENLLKRDKR